MTPDRFPTSVAVAFARLRLRAADRLRIDADVLCLENTKIRKAPRGDSITVCMDDGQLTPLRNAGRHEVTR